MKFSIIGKNVENEKDLTLQRNLTALFSNSFFLCHATLLRVTGCAFRVISRNIYLDFIPATRNPEHLRDRQTNK